MSNLKEEILKHSKIYITNSLSNVVSLALKEDDEYICYEYPFVDSDEGFISLLLNNIKPEDIKRTQNGLMATVTDLDGLEYEVFTSAEDAFDYLRSVLIWR